MSLIVKEKDAQHVGRECPTPSSRLMLSEKSILLPKRDHPEFLWPDVLACPHKGFQTLRSERHGAMFSCLLRRREIRNAVSAIEKPKHRPATREIERREEESS